MNVLVIGGGGREHALCVALRASAGVSRLLCTPGNAGIAGLAEVLPCEPTPAAWADLAQQCGVDFTVVGPDNALEAGVVDEFQARGLRIFGPTRAAARLEWSKRYAKDFMQRYAIPTARYRSFDALEQARAYLKSEPLPIVVKDSGLALGKGVTVARTLEQAEAALEAIFAFRHARGEAGEVVIEAFMVGQEVSCLALCDGRTAVMLPASQDHKTLLEQDHGPMTGGMGVIAPYPLSLAQLEEIQSLILEPILRGMALEGHPYHGVLYPGLMLTPDGIQVVEINARFGDPECEALLPLLESDLLELLQACESGTLSPELVRFRAAASAVVVLASPGYPASSTSGIPLEIPDDLPEQVTVYHCATATTRTATGEQHLVSAGGRVLAVQATSDLLEWALEDAYAAVERIGFAGVQYRRDIGFRLGLGQAAPAPGEAAPSSRSSD